MKNILEQISKVAIAQNGSAFTDQHRVLNWLGEEGAIMEDIVKAEARLNVTFPKDYIEFLLLTNGFFTPCDSTEPTFERVDKIDLLKNVDSDLLEIWSEVVLASVGEYLNRAIVIGGLNDEQYFLLIPPIATDDEWQYWKFASWHPGEQTYDSLEDYFNSVLAFLKKTN